MKLTVTTLVLCLLFSGTAKAIPVDVAVLYDGSGSIDDSEYQSVLQYVGDLVSAIRIGNADTTFGLVQFSTFAQVYQNLTQDHALVNTALNNSDQQLGQTNWTAAFDAANTMFDNYSRPGAQQVVVLVTDGVHNEGPIIDAYQSSIDLLEQGAIIFGVGFGNAVSETDLNDLVSNPSDDYTFVVDFAGDLQATIPDIVAELDQYSTPTNVPAPIGALLLLTGLGIMVSRKLILSN